MDWTISIGNLMHAGLFIVGLVGSYFALRYEIRIVRHDQSHQDQKIVMISERVDSLEVRLHRVEMDSATNGMGGTLMRQDIAGLRLDIDKK